jgi:hypothetical protein
MSTPSVAEAALLAEEFSQKRNKVYAPHNKRWSSSMVQSHGIPFLEMSEDSSDNGFFPQT